uniref:hypothetical protein n=1 Tax=Escherichia coli TaxID=562 RepID=UPI00192A6C24
AFHARFTFWARLRVRHFNKHFSQVRACTIGSSACHVNVIAAASVGWARVGTTSITTTASLPTLPMLWILLLSLLLLCGLFLASDRWVWWKAGAFSLLLRTLSAWWLIDKLSGDGLNAATLYHLGADMEG